MIPEEKTETQTGMQIDVQMRIIVLLRDTFPFAINRADQVKALNDIQHQSPSLLVLAASFGWDRTKEKAI